MAVNRDEFLSIGIHCSSKYCNQLDFLPFKCSSCSKPFCNEHWKETDHNCPLFDPEQADNRIPSCPICSKPISFPVGSDPNIAMDNHLTNFCPFLHPTLSSALGTQSSNICRAKKCAIKMVVPILCPACGNSFCASHRWREDHSCASLSLVSSSATTTATSSSSSTRLGSGAGDKLKANEGGKLISSGLAAIRRAQMSTRKALDTPPSLPSVAIKTTNEKKKGDEMGLADRVAKIALTPATNLKNDKRARGERASARKGLEARAKKGLLTEKEKLEFATDKAMQAKEGNKKDGCVIS